MRRDYIAAIELSESSMNRIDPVRGSTLDRLHPQLAKVCHPETWPSKNRWHHSPHNPWKKCSL
jgi:hypothetical protein